MSEDTIMEKLQARWDAEAAKREYDWPGAVDKLHITFEASHGGGYPKCLVDRVTEEERLRYLRELGFRVRRHFRFVETADTREEHWVELSGGIVCSLSNGWVCDKAPL